MRLRISTILAQFVLYVSVLAFTSSGSAPNVVDVGYVRYRGNLTFPNTVAYLGIPYAEPPLGERRFRAPLPLNTSRVSASVGNAIVDATQYPDFCVQGTTGSGDAGGAGSEDCLNVNIYAPAGAKSGSNLPVLVYIHGGGYVYGNPRNWPFDSWIHQFPDVVVVSVYYRLDSFGFLAHPSFSDPNLGDLNVGFQDQIQALRWVQKNIKAFGGDPSKVTINGESAGGSSVELHLVANPKIEDGLFTGAIAQSVYRTPVPTAQQQVPLFNFYAQHAGCASGDVTSQMACLRKASVSALAQAQDAASFSTALPYNNFHPVLDGALLTDYPTKLILEGKFRKVPLIVGSTSNETLSGGTNITESLKTFFPLLNAQDINGFLKEYPSQDFASEQQRHDVATGDAELKCARSLMGTAFSKQEAKVWTYRYNQPTPGAAQVGHAAENYLLFDGTSTGFNGTTTFHAQSPVDLAFASEMQAYWLSFVRSADPNVHKLARSPTWTAYSASHRARIVLQDDPHNTTTRSGSFVEVEPSDETSRCQFIAGQVEREQN